MRHKFTLSFNELQALAYKYPNNMEFGEKIREIIWEKYEDTPSYGVPIGSEGTYNTNKQSTK